MWSDVELLGLVRACSDLRSGLRCVPHPPMICLMKFTQWVESEKGRVSRVAQFFGVTPAAVTQWKTGGVPLAHMKSVVYLSHGAVTLEEMVPDARQQEQKV